MKIKYELDKETKGSYRFTPDGAGEETVGMANIYLAKPVCKSLGITPEKGLYLTFEAAEGGAE